MPPNYPQELRSLISRIDEALARLRTEIRRGKQLVRITQEYQERFNEQAFFIDKALVPRR